MNRSLHQYFYVLGAMCVVFLIPHIVSENYWLNLLNHCCVMSVACLGLNILLGYTGQINLGQMAFVGIGAYTSALLTVTFGIPVWLGMLCGAAMGGICGILLGIPSLKLSGHYLAVTTIGFGFIVQLILINWIEVTHGSDGIPQIPVLDLCGISFDDEEKYFYFSGSMVVLLTWAITRLKDSRMGRAMLAVRQNEMAASTNGINVTSCKIVSFTLSSACAGLAGAMFAHGGAHYISPDTFSFEQSVLLLAMTVLGGDGSALGAVFGATLLTLLPESLRFLQESYMMFFAAAIVLIMIYMPGGVANLLAQLPQVRAWRKRRQQAMGRELAAEAGEPVCLEKPIQRPCPDSQVLQIRDLAMYFGGIKAVDGLSMSVERGTVHALIGPNGSGKTTVINILSGLYRPTRGSITLCGQEVSGRLPHEITRLGIARTYQNIRLFAEMTVLENVMVGRHCLSHANVFSSIVHTASQRREEAALRRQAMEMLRFAGLTGLENEEAGSLPYGRQRMLEIARALMAQPEVLLLDEPAAGLNPSETADLRELLQRIQAMGITILLVEHDMELVMNVSDVITVINFGRKIAEGNEHQVRTHPEVISAYLGQEECNAAH
ncbi:branched-chain amino acid ABC transporter ATP-binding protein/permease [uncultured Desulfovibrio sp.]|jgi:branched-chain amino acid transport system permease protein|uniref:branched-chain amino acid ABC transporter ATP-binding protein/permease n=1 Tax=uncultured Desulfovibrio sp. TaxID=167968 RepID=UPI002805C4C6|nr:branched-chain amino acid ABC transporter ATP-binding protein/permease [uncultured Desulfovibrio sp.]